MGNSMGGMQTWLWAQKWPTFMDAAVPMAAQPTAMSARNWMLRRMMIETIKSDPDFQGGNYTTQPKFLKTANVFYAIATSGGSLAYQDQAPTNALADKLVDERLAAPGPRDANDFLYQWGSSADYDAAPGLEKIRAAVLAINAADDERNPPETGVMEKSLARVKDGRLLLIPASTETRGHGTTGAAKFYAAELAAFLQSVPESRPARASAR
jgi:homoserine O-acetyltransferase